jgi:hypothetical protein
MLVGKHDHGIADLDLGVTHPALRVGHAQQFRRTEGALVELDRIRRTFDDQVRVAVRYPSGIGFVAMGLAPPFLLPQLTPGQVAS